MFRLVARRIWERYHRHEFEPAGERDVLDDGSVRRVVECRHESCDARAVEWVELDDAEGTFTVYRREIGEGAAQRGGAA